MRKFGVTANVWPKIDGPPVFVPRFYVDGSDYANALSVALAVLESVQKPERHEVMVLDPRTGQLHETVSHPRPRN